MKSGVIALLVVALAIIYLVTLNYFFASYFIANFPPLSDPIRDIVAEQYDSPLSKWRKKRIGEKRANEAWQKRLKEAPEGYDPAWKVRFPTSWPKECLNDDNDERIFCDSHDDCCQSLDSDGECCQMMYCDKGLGEVESNNGQCKTWGWMLWIEPWARQRQREKDAKEKP